jgi:hypothetical protein
LWQDAEGYVHHFGRGSIHGLRLAGNYLKSISFGVASFGPLRGRLSLSQPTGHAASATIAKLFLQPSRQARQLFQLQLCRFARRGFNSLGTSFILRGFDPPDLIAFELQPGFVLFPFLWRLGNHFQDSSGFKKHGVGQQLTNLSSAVSWEALPKKQAHFSNGVASVGECTF